MLVGRLDLEEARERSLAAGVGVVLLGEPAIRPLDFVERSAARQPEDAVWIVDLGHRRLPLPASAAQLADRGELELGDRFGAEPTVRIT